MTSWIRNAPSKKTDPVPQEYFLSSQPTGATEIFNTTLYSLAYSLARSKPLNINPVNTLIGTNFDGFRSAFDAPAKLSFVDIAKPNFKQIKFDAEYYRTTSVIPETALRALATEIFTWNKDMHARYEAAQKEWALPSSFDLGIHMRTPARASRGMPTLTVKSYIDAVRAFQTAQKKKSLTLFIMTDNAQMLDEFQRVADASWKIYNLPSTSRNFEGFTPDNFRGLPRSQRLSAFYEFMTELMIMQNIESVITTFSSNTGRFLYITSNPTHRFISLDEKVYRPYYFNF